MNMQEIQAPMNYLIKIPPRERRDKFNRIFTQQGIVLAKRLTGAAKHRPEGERGKTRTVPCALEYTGYDTKVVQKERYTYIEEEQRWGNKMEDVETIDYTSEYTTRWLLAEVPINRVSRLWDEYIEEKEIEEEIKRAQREEAEARAEERRRELEEQKAKRQAESQERADKVRTWLTSQLGDKHGIELEVGWYGISITLPTDIRSIEYWERLMGES